MMPTNPEARFYLVLLTVVVLAWLATLTFAGWAIVVGDRERRARRAASRAVVRLRDQLRQAERVDPVDRHFFTTPAAVPRQPKALRDRIRAEPPVRLSKPAGPVDTATIWLTTLDGHGYAGSDVT